MSAVSQAVPWARRTVGAVEAPSETRPALLVVIEALVDKSAATGAKTITVACTDRELTIVDDGKGLPKLEALFDDDGSFRRTLLALSQRPKLAVTSTHVHVRNRALIDVRMQATVGHERSLPSLPSTAGRGGFAVVAPWKTGTQITVTEIAHALAMRRSQLGADFESRMRSKHPGITITVTH